MSNCQLLVVYPESSIPHLALARRLFAACQENSQEANLYSSGELDDIAEDQLCDTTIAVVDPVECATASRNRSGFFSKLVLARKRVMVWTEAVENGRYNEQFRLPIDFDAVFDVGFVSQEDKHSFTDVPYHFVFNGPTNEEEQIIANLAPVKERDIPWALVGYQTPEHLELVAALIDYGSYPEGFVFLPRFRRPKQRDVPLAPADLTAVLSRTKYYVWSVHRSPGYYESTRFIQALLAGAAPCEISGNNSGERTHIPGVFPTVRSFCKRVREGDYWSMYSMVREHYISKGSLAEHLEKALCLV